MPLIQCPDCNSDVSDRSKNCIKCGCPIQKIVHAKKVDEKLKQTIAEIGDNKKFKVGRQVVNWGGGAFLKNVSADIEQGDLGALEPGNFLLYRHKAGIRIRNKGSNLAYYDIHFRQIIDINESSAEEMVHEKKSVIGRGIAGGLLLGPAAAIVGALSAMNASSLKKLTIIKLSFCEPKDFSRRDIFFRVPRNSSTLFVIGVQKEVANVRPSYKNIFLRRSIPHLEKISPKQADKIRAQLGEG